MFAQSHDIPALTRWLKAVMVLVVLMVALGGFTRLSESGLSIVEWKLFSGTFPPLSAEAWDTEFAAYQQSPEYQQVNQHFGVAEFKKIYWLEYLHRLLGRIIGLSVILPLAWFWARGMLTPAMKRRGVALAVLVAAQGTVGWVMVASGLVDQPRVAPVKLALHLSLAFVFFLALLDTYWRLRPVRQEVVSSAIAWAVKGVFLLIFLQIILGALVAGLDAGLSYNTYPLMDGAWVPEGLHRLDPWWKNHLESVLTVQFQHRMGAVVVVAAALLLAALSWHQLRHRTPLQWLLALISLQFLLGVATLLTHVQMVLAVAHQLLALALLATCLMLVKAYPSRQG